MDLLLRSPRQGHWQSKANPAHRGLTCTTGCSQPECVYRAFGDWLQGPKPTSGLHSIVNPEMQCAWRFGHCVTSSKPAPSQIPWEAMISEAPGLAGGLCLIYRTIPLPPHPSRSIRQHTTLGFAMIRSARLPRMRFLYWLQP